MSWGDGAGVPNSGQNLVILGIDNNDRLHIRIFDPGGNPVTDADETKVPAHEPGRSRSSRSESGNPCPHTCRTREEKDLLIDAATSLVDQAPPKVINVSMGYNWGADFARLFDAGPVGQAAAQQPAAQQDAAGKEAAAAKEAKRLVQQQGILMQSRIRRAQQKGIIFVCAAGNESRGGAVRSQWSLAFNWVAQNPVGGEPPAKNVLVVGAVDQRGMRAAFSNIGCHIAAPGVEVMSLTHLDERGLADPKGVRLADGTSMAAPFVTAAIAQIYACYPDTPWQRVISSVTKDRGIHDEPPVLDALDALLRANDDSLLHLADLDGDGDVDGDDEAQLARALNQYRADKDHNYWPREDLNGDGEVSDAKPPPGLDFDRTEIRRPDRYGGHETCLQGAGEPRVPGRRWSGTTHFTTTILAQRSSRRQPPMNRAWPLALCCTAALMGGRAARAGFEQDNPPEVITRDGITVRWAWHDRDPEIKPKFAEGGYYLRSGRFMAAWHFNDAIRRGAKAGGGRRACRSRWSTWASATIASCDTSARPTPRNRSTRSPGCRGRSWRA